MTKMVQNRNSKPSGYVEQLHPDMNRGDWVRDKLQQFLSRSPGSIVADIGAGYSWMQGAVEDLALRYRAFDRVPKQDWITRWDLDEPPPVGQNRFDAVLFMEVLEHLDNPFRGLQHLCQLLEPGGLLFMTTPNPGWSGSRISHLTDGFLFHFQPKHLDEHHVFPAWPHVTMSFLDRCGMEVVEFATIDNPEPVYNHGLVGNSKLYIKTLIRKAIESRDPGSRGMLYGIVARKRSSTNE